MCSLCFVAASGRIELFCKFETFYLTWVHFHSMPTSMRSFIEKAYRRLGSGDRVTSMESQLKARFYLPLNHLEIYLGPVFVTD